MLKVNGLLSSVYQDTLGDELFFTLRNMCKAENIELHFNTLDGILYTELGKQDIYPDRYSKTLYADLYNNDNTVKNIEIKCGSYVKNIKLPAYSCIKVEILICTFLADSEYVLSLPDNTVISGETLFNIAVDDTEYIIDTELCTLIDVVRRG